MPLVLPALEPWTDICCHGRSSTLLFAPVVRSLLSEVSPHWPGLLSGPLVLLASFFPAVGMKDFSRRGASCVPSRSPTWNLSGHLPTSSSPCWMFLEAERQFTSSWELPSACLGFPSSPHHLRPWVEPQGTPGGICSPFPKVFFTPPSRFRSIRHFLPRRGQPGRQLDVWPWSLSHRFAWRPQCGSCHYLKTIVPTRVVCKNICHLSRFQFLESIPQTSWTLIK